MNTHKDKGVKKYYTLVSKECVNSSWPAKWLAEGDEEHCQCNFSCKVKVHFKRDGYGEWDYVITEQEYKNL